MMRLNRLSVICLCLALLFAAAPTHAQDFRGRINGVVTDNTGAVLPGVTVTATSPALIQPQVQVTQADGNYRFLALPPGVYEVAFELAGFQNVKREGIRVVIGQTLTVDQQLQVATLQETVTVTGASPVVDTTTTTMGTNFTKELLTEIPNARDIWAAMSQAPGIQMQGYDVGGSHTGTQTGLRHLRSRRPEPDEDRRHRHHRRHRRQRRLLRLRLASKNSRWAAPAATPRASRRGASLTITVKSGGDKFTGNWYSDWEGDATISDNVPDNLKIGQHARTRTASSFADAAHAGQPDRSPVRHQLQRRRSARGRARRGSSTAIASTTSTSSSSASDAWRGRS